MNNFLLKTLPVLGSAALVLAACGGSSDAPEETTSAAPAPTESSSAPVEPSLSGEITVLAAASLQETFESIAESFETEEGVKVILSFGGSDTLAQQINQGAPADVFAAASEATMQLVVDEGGNAEEPTIFAENLLTIAVPAGSGKVTSLADLENLDNKVAICEESVPCGAATRKLFEANDLSVQAVTLEENVRSVLNKVVLDEVDAGLTYVTDVAAAIANGDAVEGIEIPKDNNQVTRYPIATLKEAPNPEAAAAFVAYVTSPAGMDILAEAGFLAP